MVPWKGPTALIEPYYPKGEGSRTAYPLTIIHAPSSTKNKDGKRDPEMHQTKKGNQYYFGMKSHIGVDADSGLVHGVIGTAVNVADVAQVDRLLDEGAVGLKNADFGPFYRL